MHNRLRTSGTIRQEIRNGFLLFLCPNARRLLANFVWKPTRSTKKTSQLYRGSTFLQYHKGIPGEGNPAGAKTALGGVHK